MTRPLLFACALALAACSSTTTTAPTLSATPSDSINLDPSGSPSSVAGSPIPGAGSTTPDPPAPPRDGPTRRAGIDPPRAGMYRYEQSGETRAGAFSFEPDSEGTLDIAEPDGARQSQERRYSSTQSIEQVLLYRPTGVYLARYTSRFATQEVDCRLDEPLLLVALPMSVGRSWQDDGSCNGLEMDVRGVVVSSERRTVGGTTVKTFRLKVTVEARGDGLRQTSIQHVWISPAYRLIVHAIDRSEGTYEGQAFSSKRTDDLISLQPS